MKWGEGGGALGLKEGGHTALRVVMSRPGGEKPINKLRGICSNSVGSRGQPEGREGWHRGGIWRSVAAIIDSRTQRDHRVS